MLFVFKKIDKIFINRLIYGVIFDGYIVAKRYNDGEIDI